MTRWQDASFRAANPFRYGDYANTAGFWAWNEFDQTSTPRSLGSYKPIYPGVANAQQFNYDWNRFIENMNLRNANQSLFYDSIFSFSQRLDIRA
jgi:hypothetical protein